jgi:hypothetical protein
MKSPTTISLQPTLRTLPSGKIAVFYSPQQLEVLIPVQQRIPQSRGSNMDIRSGTGVKSSTHTKTDYDGCGTSRD